MSVELLGFSSYITLLIQIPIGAITYLGLAYLFKFECFNYILNILKEKNITKSKPYASKQSKSLIVISIGKYIVYKV